jgi:hypothetical protein
VLSNKFLKLLALQAPNFEKVEIYLFKKLITGGMVKVLLYSIYTPKMRSDNFPVYAVPVTVLSVGLPKKKKKGKLRHLISLSRVTY